MFSFRHKRANATLTCSGVIPAKTGFRRHPLPLALPHPGSNPRWSSRKLSYSYVNEKRGQVTDGNHNATTCEGSEKNLEVGRGIEIL
jgi:hypothetical protein